jgi:hypothetical protein
MLAKMILGQSELAGEQLLDCEETGAQAPKYRCWKDLLPKPAAPVADWHEQDGLLWTLRVASEKGAEDGVGLRSGS